MEKQNNITPFEKDISKWYSDLVLKSNLISYGPIKGTMFFKPYGFAIWNNITKIFNKEFDKLGVEEVKFPLLFPESLLSKEKDHIKGFAPEVLTVTRVGQKKLEESLIIRPTSEVLFGIYFRENLNSYSQLPLKLNQWVNIMRWENNTRPFLRNSEFFWQEGHTIHSTENEAHEFAKKIHELYQKIVREYLLLPTIKGEKTIMERFAGANNTYTIETILKDGQALQTGTSHYLGDSFTKAFNVKVQGSDNIIYNPFQTSWGVSTRLIGAIIMTHSDNKGLILPSKIAPFQIVILTLFADKEPKILETANKLHSILDKFKVKIDDSNKGIGFKNHKWELKGSPIRIEIGPKDIKQEKVILSIRNGKSKVQYNLSDINNETISKLLLEYDKTIYNNAIKSRDDKRIEFNSVDEIKEIVDNGKYGVAFWEDNMELEKKIKKETGATIRCLINSEFSGKCINSGVETNKLAIFARAY
ncbi:MAG: proline--tRNA ligase [Mycoplasmataceae bacterium]|nr:proline--tRNA ligase [Mycoplasmataceae bacterium]